MTNPYLARLRGQIQEKQHPSEPSKPSKPRSEGFEGDQECHFFENEQPANAVVAADRVKLESAKSATTADPQNLQNQPDGLGARVTTIAIPAEGPRFRRAYAHLQLRAPTHIEETRWRQCISDGRTFLRQWGDQAQALGWTSANLFGLHQPPDQSHPSYRRLSRYDAAGLCWLLESREVVALTGEAAVIRTSTGATLTYYRHGRPALGPLGDSLEGLK